MNQASHWMIRPEAESDYEAIDRIHLTAFGRDSEGRLVRALRCLPEFEFDLSLVAEVERSIVGHILFTPIHIRGPIRTFPALALAPMAVLPDWQNRGVGSSLVQEGIGRCRRRGHARIIVLGHSEYYSRFGFKPASRFGLRAPFPVPEEAFMAMALQPNGLGACSGVVEYSSPFADV